MLGTGACDLGGLPGLTPSRTHSTRLCSRASGRLPCPGGPSTSPAPTLAAPSRSERSSRPAPQCPKPRRRAGGLGGLREGQAHTRSAILCHVARTRPEQLATCLPPAAA